MTSATWARCRETTSVVTQVRKYLTFLFRRLCIHFVILDGDSAPWCIAPNGEFDYCDIPECKDDADNTVANDRNPVSVFESTAVGEQQRCKSEQFQCRVGECVLSVYVCDGQNDCSNGKDEEECSQTELEK